MFILPLVTVLREGIEAVVFIAGVSFSASPTSIPLPVVIGILAGSVIGYIIYKGGASAKLQYFLVISTCILYLVGAGLFSKAVWYFEAQKWNNEVGGDAAEVGVRAGSYDITKSVWHVNYGSPYIRGGGGWGIFNGILGWQNSATYGSVISYNVYWIFIIGLFLSMRYNEVKGHWPMMGGKKIAGETRRQDFIISGTASDSTLNEIVDNETRAKAAEGFAPLTCGDLTKPTKDIVGSGAYSAAYAVSDGQLVRETLSSPNKPARLNFFSTPEAMKILRIT